MNLKERCGKMEKKNKEVLCNLKTCLNYENGKCSIASLPYIDEVISNSIKCKFFDDDFKKTFKEFMAKGGMQGAIARMRGKKTEEEIAEVKKLKRKSKSDKVKKPKKENTLEDLI
jgi:hypothetical protein